MILVDFSREYKKWNIISRRDFFVNQILVLGGVRLQIEQAPQDFSKGKKA